MDQQEKYNLPLGELLELLKSGGYELSIQQILEIQSLLLNTSLREISPLDLKYLITPVVAKNDEEQNSIYRLVDAWVTNQTKKTITTPGWWKLWLARHPRQIFAFKLAAFLLIIATGLFLYFFTGKKSPSGPPGVRTGVAPAKPNTAKTSTTIPTPGNANAASKKPAATEDTAKTIASGTARYEKQINPEPINNSLQMSLAFGILAGAIIYHLVFYERKRKMDLEKKKRTEESIFIAPSEDARLTVGREHVKTDPFEKVVLEFPPNDFLVQKPGTFAAIKSDLKKPVPIENPALNIRQSIKSTIRNAGFRTVEFGSPWKARKLIVIHDNSNPDAHISHVLNFLADYLHAALRPVTSFTYTYDISILKDPNNNTQYLEELAYRTADHDLVILGYAHTFFSDAESQPIKKLLDIFRQWPSRSIITPIPLPDWTDREVQLQQYDFRVVPADLEAIGMLSASIAEGNKIRKEQLARRITDMYSVTAYNFHSIQGLKDYLRDEQAFQLACSLAVYPTLNWRVTLALFDSIIKRYPGKYRNYAVSYDLLLKMARIPWMYADKLDDTVRLRLLECIEPETELVAREAIIRLLDEVKYNTPKGSVAFKELQVQYNLNAFFLYSHDKVTYKDYSASREVITYYWNNLKEKALKDHITNNRNNLLPVNKDGDHKPIEEFVMQEEQFEKRNISLLRLALLILPAFLLYIIFSLIKPGFVYPPGKYRNVTVWAVIEKKDSCAGKLTHATVLKNGIFSSHPLNRKAGNDTILVPDMIFSDPGEFYELELWSGDNPVQAFSVLAKDSFFIVPVQCK